MNAPAVRSARAAGDLVVPDSHDRYATTIALASSPGSAIEFVGFVADSFALTASVRLSTLNDVALPVFETISMATLLALSPIRMVAPAKSSVLPCSAELSAVASDPERLYAIGEDG